MKKSIVLLIAVVLSIHCIAQESIYQLHPLVGDTIDKNEKFNYLLFQNIKESDYQYGTLTRSGHGFFLRACAPNNQVSVIEIDSMELKQYIEKLDKVAAYLNNEGKTDTISASSGTDAGNSKFEEINNSIINQESRKRILKEVRTENRMKEDAERYQQRMKGTDISGAGRIELPVIKTKKRK